MFEKIEEGIKVYQNEVIDYLTWLRSLGVSEDSSLLTKLNRANLHRELGWKSKIDGMGETLGLSAKEINKIFSDVRFSLLLEKEESWGIFTNDSDTNEIIATELPGANTIDGASCFDKVSRKMWGCDKDFVFKMIKNRKKKKLDFSIYHKKDGMFFYLVEENDFIENYKVQAI
ncbi:MAG: hypothetical protein WCI41_03920 [bacterium]